MPLIGTPIEQPTDTAPATTTPTEMVSDYMDIMADQDFRKSWKEGSNSAEHLLPSELRDLYRLQKEREADQARQSNGIFRRIID